ncbi:unnamed protein product [Mesocestoides corti]|uniref:Ig-like domain-containing protein n=1 Tax=Mesocestoides corti TaxID=53468 RepID=A0A3P6GVQ8_MESCO|nr:unnamed protein product [Mesocestoides corti]
MSEPLHVKTLTTSTILLKIYSPPEGLLLRHVTMPEASKPTNKLTNKPSPDHLQSDNPEHGESQAFQHPAFPHSTSQQTLPIHQHHSSSPDRPLVRNGNIWALENDQVSMECSASPSYPVSRLMWVLSAAEDAEELLPQPCFDFHQFACRTRASSSQRYPKWRFVFDAREQEKLGFTIVNKELPAPVDGLFIGLSTITITMDRSLSGRRLECLVQNAAAFEQSVMPKVTANLQVVYIQNMNITHNVSTEDRMEEPFRENETVRFYCSAEGNPRGLRNV